MAKRNTGRGPGRPPLPLVAVRSHNISVRVNGEAFAAFTAAAKASGKTRAAWIRERLFSALKQGSWAP